MRRLLLPVLLACIGPAACQASVSGSASADTSAGAESDATGEASASGAAEDEDVIDQTDDQGRAQISATGERAGDGAMLGARHDLRLAGRTSPVCSCLAVALGRANDSRLSWHASAPQLDPGTQLVIAFSSKGQPCQGELEGSLGASYWGYKWSGNDVVVFVEGARSGRPLTSGAIIPKPLGTGQVYMQPVNAHVPYGRPLSGKGNRCALGNPGPPRTKPPSVEEEGNLEMSE